MTYGGGPTKHGPNNRLADQHEAVGSFFVEVPRPICQWFVICEIVFRAMTHPPFEEYEIEELFVLYN